MSDIVLMFGQFRFVTPFLFHLRDRVLLRTSSGLTSPPAGTLARPTTGKSSVFRRLVHQLCTPEDPNASGGGELAQPTRSGRCRKIHRVDVATLSSCPPTTTHTPLPLTFFRFPEEALNGSV